MILTRSRIAAVVVALALCMGVQPMPLEGREDIDAVKRDAVRSLILKERQEAMGKVLDVQEILNGNHTDDLDQPRQEGAVLQDRPTFMQEISAMRKTLEEPITVNFRNVEMSYVLDFISRSTGVNIFVSRTMPLDEMKLSIKIRNMPLKSALRYILRKRKLDYRIERNVIWVATPEEFENENIETRVYTLSYGSGYHTRFSQAVAGPLGQAGGAGGLGGAAQVSDVTKIVDIIEQAVPFPKGSRLVFDERSGSIIIANTPSNLSVAEEILFQLDIKPVQVLIEARFIELDVTDLEEFGIDFELDSPLGLDQTSDGTAGALNRAQINTGSGFNFSSLSRAASEGFNFSLAGILTRPRFTATLNALSETRRAKTLSAPKITTLNHQTATIEIVTEEIYPSRFEVAFTRTSTQTPAEGEFENVPQEFVTRDVGIVLQVTPHVGADLRTITMTVIPTVSEVGTAFSYSGNISLPRFTTRSVATTVILEDGQTVVLGGLMTETDSQSNFREIPFLSDLPMIGPLFRRESHSLRRRNLLIFVTASVVKPQFASSVDK